MTNVDRRVVVVGGILGVTACNAAPAIAAMERPAAAAIEISIAAKSPKFLANAVAVGPKGEIVLGLPRWTGMEETPSVVRVETDGSLRPFPGGGWNDWRPGKDARDAFVQVNALHIFGDGTLWVVDQGTADRQTTLPGAQKVLQFDLESGRLLRALRFGSDILPDGAQLNDLRVHGGRVFLTDSGLGGIVVHDLESGRTIRRLSGAQAMLMDAKRPMKGAGGRVFADQDEKSPVVHSDMLEVSPDGRSLYVATPTGPLRRIPVSGLTDPAVTEEALAASIETIAEIPTIGGTAIDTRGNIYLADGENGRIVVLTPGGAKVTLVEDKRLVSPDAIFIDAGRTLYVPAPQTERLAEFAGGTSKLSAPFLTLSLRLPDALDGHPLGNAVTG